jgi:hypothetical protein
MKKTSDEFLMVRRPGKTTAYIMQTGGLQIIGAVMIYYTNRKAMEAHRQEFLRRRTNPYLYAKARGYRAYATLSSGLQDIPDDVLRMHYDEIHDTLQMMAEFYVRNFVEPELLDLLADPE